MGSFFNWVLLLLVVSLVAVYFFGAGLGRIFKRLRGNSSMVGNDGVNSKGSKNSDASKDGEPKKKQFHFNFINVFFFGGLPHFDCLLLECEDE